MSTEHDKNKVTIDDEQFIDALYAELETELESELKNRQDNELTTNSNDILYTEQPSKSLDQSILAAAHKAIESSPKTIDLAGEKSSIIKRTRAWHVPLSLAASTVLVVSLAVNQGEESVLPNRDVMLAPRTVQIEHTLSNESAGIAERKVMAQGQSRDLAKQSSHQAMKKTKSSVQNLAQVSALAARSQENEDGGEMSALPAFKAPPSIISLDEPVRKIASEDRARLKEKSSASKLEGSRPMPLLSLQQYQLYKKQNKQWFLRNESEQYYVIDVFDSEQKAIQYKLLKKHFKINTLTRKTADFHESRLANDIELKHSFEQIEALD